MLGLSPYSGPNRVGFITLRRGQSQSLKRRGFILVYRTMDLVKKTTILSATRNVFLDMRQNYVMPHTEDDRDLILQLDALPTQFGSSVRESLHRN
jgi:hypothetical protein